jgi:hypothetical protein
MSEQWKKPHFSLRFWIRINTEVSKCNVPEGSDVKYVIKHETVPVIPLENKISRLLSIYVYLSVCWRSACGTKQNMEMQRTTLWAMAFRRILTSVFVQYFHWTVYFLETLWPVEMFWRKLLVLRSSALFFFGNLLKNNMMNHHKLLGSHDCYNSHCGLPS